MKVTDLKKNECIHCETEEQSKAICKLMHEAGLEWKGSKSYLSENNYFVYKSETCYFPTDGEYADLHCAKQGNYKIYKAEQFLNQKQEVMSTVVTINPDTSEINITPKEGFEIDMENSDIKNGKVLFKEVEKKYSDVFGIPDKITKIGLYTKYATKLSILDTLLCLRDEYNRIDGFTEGFRFGVQNWCITPYEKNLEITQYYVLSRIMHFGKEETTKLFLKNFEEQLEQIKEFL